MDRTYVQMKRSRLDAGDRFVTAIVDNKDAESVYAVDDRVVAAVTRTFLSETPRSVGWHGEEKPKPANCYAQVIEYETWVKYSTLGYSAWLNLTTGLSHYSIGGETLAHKPWPEHIFLIRPL